MRDLMKEEEVYTTIADQCMYGLTTWTPGSKGVPPCKEANKVHDELMGVGPRARKQVRGKT